MIDSILTLCLVTTLLLGSPGPAPLALAATSATFGIKQGIPFLVGILSGLCIAIMGATFGIATLLIAYPLAKIMLQVVGGLYILYVAIKIATAPIVLSDTGDVEKAPRFLDGFILNLLNPKAYAAFLAIFSQFLIPSDSVFFAYLLTALICMLVAVCVDTLWLCLGGLLRPLFSDPGKARLLRFTFAILMAVAVFWSFLQ